MLDLGGIYFSKCQEAQSFVICDFQNIPLTLSRGGCPNNPNNSLTDLKHFGANI